MQSNMYLNFPVTRATQNLHPSLRQPAAFVKTQFEKCLASQTGEDKVYSHSIGVQVELQPFTDHKFALWRNLVMDVGTASVFIGEYRDNIRKKIQITLNAVYLPCVLCLVPQYTPWTGPDARDGFDEFGDDSEPKGYSHICDRCWESNSLNVELLIQSWMRLPFGHPARSVLDTTLAINGEACSPFREIVKGVLKFPYVDPAKFWTDKFEDYLTSRRYNRTVSFGILTTDIDVVFVYGTTPYTTSKMQLSNTLQLLRMATVAHGRTVRRRTVDYVGAQEEEDED